MNIKLLNVGREIRQGKFPFQMIESRFYLQAQVSVDDDDDNVSQDKPQKNLFPVAATLMSSVFVAV